MEESLDHFGHPDTAQRSRDTTSRAAQHLNRNITVHFSRCLSRVALMPFEVHPPGGDRSVGAACTGLVAVNGPGCVPADGGHRSIPSRTGGRASPLPCHTRLPLPLPLSSPFCSSPPPPPTLTQHEQVPLYIPSAPTPFSHHQPSGGSHVRPPFGSFSRQRCHLRCCAGHVGCVPSRPALLYRSGRAASITPGGTALAAPGCLTPPPHSPRRRAPGGG